jgi:hypothetical protein
MLDARTLYSKIQNESEKTGWPVNHRGDIESDEMLLKRSALETPHREYIWILRDRGTCLIPLFEGIDPVHVENWSEGLFYHAIDDKLNSIPKAMAFSLIQEPPFNIKSCTSLPFLVDKMMRLLDSPWSRNEMFSLNNDNTNEASWGAWKNAFDESGNKLMVEFIANVQRQAATLTKLRLVA